MTQDLQKLQAAALTPPVKKEPLDVNVQLNQNPTVGIDPAAVVLERAGRRHRAAREECVERPRVG